MAKKKKKEENLDKVKSFLLDIFLKNIISSIKGQFDYFLGKVQDKIYQIEKGIIERLIAATFLLTGIIFLFLALTNYLIEIRAIPKTHSYLIVGIVLILLSILMKFIFFGKSNKT